MTTTMATNSDLGAQREDTLAASPSDSPHGLEPPSWKLGFDAVESDWVTSGPSSRR
jgi:hypothetical protein